MAELGVDEGVIDYVINCYKNPPIEAYTVNQAVEQITGRPARTFAEWAEEHARYFKIRNGNDGVHSKKA